MLGAIIFTVVISKYVSASDQLWRNLANKDFIYNNTYKYDNIIDVIVNSTKTQILDFTEESELLSGFPTRVHVSTNDTTNLEYPLFVTAVQQKGVSSWELPLVIPTRTAVLQFNDMARTLCPHDAGPNITAQSRPTLTLATSSPENILVKIKLKRVQNFYVEVDKEVTLNMTPSSPKYYYFSFDRDPWNLTETKNSTYIPKFNYKPKSVLLMIDSDDDVCAFVSIQNNSCPVFDNEKDMLYQGYYFTMSHKGGITITQSMFPRGFYIVFIVKESDEDCTGISDSESGVRNPGSRFKTFRFRAMEAVSYGDYITGVLVVLALMSCVALLGPIGTAIYCKSRTQPNTQHLPEPVNTKGVEEIVLNDETPGPSSSRTEPSVSESVPVLNHDSNDSDLESEPDIGNSLPMPLNVAGLSRACPVAQTRRSNRYFWSALTVAVVYALPVVQLLFTYQRLIFQTGDQDVCYYNFLCAHPLGVLADFNHVYSNIGYVILGLVFMAQIRCRRKFRNIDNQELGIPQHRGLLYSMGLALVMEGLLSACYHLCPNKMNFQFDSSFMYVIAVLCMIKLYQSRHPDVNASAHTTFMLLALLMAIGCLGMMYPNKYFWTFFTIMHLGVCFILTLQIYYVGRLKIEPSIVVKAWKGIKQHGRSAFIPVYRARGVLLVIANIANWALAGYGIYEHGKDLARHLLAILLGNTLLYTLGYVVLKLVHREKISIATLLWLALAHVSWVLAALLFTDSKTHWSQTPAQSRNLNAVCSALNMLDSHDLWHLASASAIFFSFNALLILDDPLADTPRHLIPVF
ncbi:SID1 transmembrane family member 1-like isoform X1 [Maniola jurtina]|uniref:SID1 transmembrane family member 1-like isoform X1 n=1 Tax=Maniola jurtina TaxID=191418 RepID=UPI001E687651|nr:SID1 transmembrane family member 1-like isoform X1 [Maniola jurtina]